VQHCCRTNAKRKKEREREMEKESKGEESQELHGKFFVEKNESFVIKAKKIHKIEK
jgi:hypothetical protein